MMKKKLYGLIHILIFMVLLPLYAQDENCFLEDFYPKNAHIPASIEKEKTTAAVSCIVTVDKADTLGKISRYILGNAIAAWVGNDIYNPTFMSHVDKLAPTLIRYPGGSWADMFFWDGIPDDIPEAGIYIASDDAYYEARPGVGSWPTTTDTYYDMRWDLDTQGLITINYGYARYGTSTDPVAQAAHLAADWVRYDDGRTLFWEIGNENAGSWEAGWQIDTTLNQDGQPEIITGELYGKHFKVIADSMRAASAELDVDIYIGGQILHYDGSGSSNIPDRDWNESFFREVGDQADFYVVHNYFGTSTNARVLLDEGTSIPNEMMDFIEDNIADKEAAVKPIALTEWNMTGWGGYEEAKTSTINGMQAVIVFNELIKRNYGMSSRWLLANWGSDGMLYKGDDAGIPTWSPRPDFFYVYYLPQFIGDYALNTSSSRDNIVAYSSTFASGEIGAIVVNKGGGDIIVKLNIPNQTVGDKFYVYSLTGGDDDRYFSQYVYINETEPTENYFGPIDGLEDIPAWAYPIDGEIRFNSPGRSVQFVMIESGENVLSINKEVPANAIKNFELYQNYPNPFNPKTVISWQLSVSSHVELSIFDILGQKIAILVDNIQAAGPHNIEWDASGISTGIYYYRLTTEDGNSKIHKMIVMK